MLAKPLRTYQRKPAKSTFTGFKWPVVQIEKRNVETSHPLKNSLDDSLNDPFETTFDRIAKGAVVPPRPPDTNRDISWDSSSSNNDTNKSCDLFDHVSPTPPTCNNTSRFTRSITHSNTNISWKYRNPTKCKREVAAPKKKVSVRKKTISTSKDKIKEESKQPQKTQGRKKRTSRRSKQRQLKESRNLHNKERLHVYSNTVSIPEDTVQKKDISCNSKESRSESVLTIDGTSRTESTGSGCSVADSKYLSNCARDIRPCFVKLNARAVQHWHTLHRNKSLKDEQDAYCNTTVLRADTSEADQTSLTIKKTDAQSISLEGDNAVRSFKDTLIKSCSVVLDSSVVKDWILKNKRSVYSVVAAEDKQNSRSLSETAARDSDMCPYVTKRNRGKLAKSDSAKQARTKEAVEEDDAASMPRRKRSIISSTPIKKRVRLNGFPACSVLPSPIDGSLPVLDTMSKYSMKDDATEDDRVNEHSEVHSPSSRTAFGNSGITCAKVECKSETFPGSQPISQSVIDISIEISKNFKDEATKVDKYDIPDEADGVHTVLMELEDPIRITVKRKQYVKWQLSASDIFESVINDSSVARSGEASAVETSATKSLPNRLAAKAASNSTQPCDNGAGDKRKEKKIFLKSGKNWTRSLSILTNINNETENLDRMSVGKGRKWRASVRDVFDMQRQGVLQSCLRIDEDATNLSRDTLDVSDVPSFGANNKRTALNSTNHARLSKRISMRVVPNSTTAKCDMRDTAFLEAFGIIEEKSKLSHREKSPVPDGDTLVDRESEIARKVVLQKCSQNRYLPFSKCFPNSYLEHCHKIGEGVYGEVFLYERDGDKSVLKIIPIEGNELVNGEPQKKFHEILSEIVIAKELANLKSNAAYRTDGFVEVKDVNCVVGKYPKKLVELWNIYDDNKTSDNDCPSMFGKNQLYIALELSHGGQDLEAFVFPTAEEACAVFLQIALALAVGEKALEFEHRDLHWGNVLISRTKEPYVYYILGEKEIELPSKGMKVSIIDFTLSRMSYQGCCIYNDLSLDPALFTAHGDYQFDIYRLMRDKTGNDWRQFEPHTNVLWLHYTLDKMITAVRYEKKSTKMHKSAINKLRELKNTVLQYRSAFDFVINSDSIESACGWRKEKC